MKNNNKSVIALIMVIICLLIGGSFLVCKLLDDNSSIELENNNQSGNKNNQDNSWFDYVLNSEITSMKLISCNGTKEITIELSYTELENIFDSMKNGKLVKDYDGGLGGICLEHIIIDYKSKNKEYKLDLINNEYIDLEYLEDNTISSYLENSTYTVQNNSNSDNTKGFYYDYDKTFIEKIVYQNTEKKGLDKWADYLLKQDIQEIKYNSGKMDNQTCQSPVTLTKDQLTKILSKMTASPLTKTNVVGLGGICMPSLYIKYNNKELRIYANQVIDAKNADNEILSLLEKENYIPEIYDHIEKNWYYRYNWDSAYIDTIVK